MKTPSRSQKQAISHLSGPAQVIAGPGSGKTFTIIQRILYLIKHYHIRPDKILVITYTKAAANEMKERYEKACTADKDFVTGFRQEGVCFGTFHSICYHILRQSDSSKTISLIKESDKRKLLQVILNNQGLSSKCTYDNISRLQNSISRMKNLAEALPEEVPEQAVFTYNEMLLVKEEYDSYLREQGLLDFDDMITECLKLLGSNQSVLERYQQMFEYILADEFQDINLPQYEILKLLALPHNNLFVVGDDDQAIYGFRGATPGIMRKFMDEYPKGTQIRLTENYRSGAAIVTLAGQMIAGNRERFYKEFRPTRPGGKIDFFCFDTRREEEVRLKTELSSLNEDQLANTAVILRTNREVMLYTELLKEAGIAVKGKRVSDTDFFHSFIMEDILFFLAYLYEGGKRRDFIGFMNKPNHFFTRSALLDERVKEEHMAGYYAKNPAMLKEIGLYFQQLKIASGLQPYLAISFFRKTIGYERYLRKKARNYGEYQRWVNQCDKIQNCFKGLSQGTDVRKFAEDQAEKAGSDAHLTEEIRGASVMTMHGAKGLEFDRVFLPDINEGIIPGKECTTANSLEEERRLLYVAITRAENELHIYYTKERGRKLSGFLEGLIPPP